MFLNLDLDFADKLNKYYLRFDNHDFRVETNDLKQKTISSKCGNIKLLMLNVFFKIQM